MKAVLFYGLGQAWDRDPVRDPAFLSLWTEWQTDTIENITFQQLCWRAVKNRGIRFSWATDSLVLHFRLLAGRIQNSVIRTAAALDNLSSCHACCKIHETKKSVHAGLIQLMSGNIFYSCFISTWEANCVTSRILLQLWCGNSSTI